MSDTNLWAQQQRNRRLSAVLVGVFVAFFAWIGFGADLILYLQTSAGEEPGRYIHRIPLVGLAATLLAFGTAWFSWRRGPKEVLWATGAWELIKPSNDAEHQLVNVVEEMAIASGLPRPKIWIVKDADPNAFATGTDERNAHVAVTEGLLTTLNRDQLQGVIAHEMAHIQNYDVRLMTLLAALVGVLALISEGTWRFFFYGGKVGGGGSKSSGGGGSKKGGGGLIVLLIILWVVSVLLAPIISRLLALGVSRKREYLADATAAQFTRNPGALAEALDTIEHAAAPTKAIKRGSAHLCIADPLGRRVTNKQGFFANAFATHPPMAVRVARLKKMAYQYEQTGELPEAAL